MGVRTRACICVESPSITWTIGIAEGGGLAGAGLGLTHDVESLGGDWYDAGLDWGRLGVPHAFEGMAHGAGDDELAKGGLIGQNRGDGNRRGGSGSRFGDRGVVRFALTAAALGTGAVRALPAASLGGFPLAVARRAPAGGPVAAAGGSRSAGDVSDLGGLYSGQRYDNLALRALGCDGLASDFGFFRRGASEHTPHYSCDVGQLDGKTSYG